MIEQLGRAGVVLAAVGAIAWGSLSLYGGGRGEGELVVWAFDAGSAASYPAAFEGARVRVDVLPSPLLNARAGARALAGASGGGPSELIEVEIGSVGKYFRGRAEGTFLVPLAGEGAEPPRQGDREEGDGALLETRLAHWRYRGVQLAWPRDVHPVVLVYRDDLWREAGVEVRSLRTWAELIDACRVYEDYWAAKGHPEYRSMELPRSGAGVVHLILQQRGLSLTDEAGMPRLADPRVAATLVEYASWVGGEDAVGSSPARRIDLTAEDLASGRVGAMLAADWRLGQLKRVMPDLAGKLSAAPLPVFDDADPGHDAPTASWGGTGVAVPRDARDPARARRLAWKVATDREAGVARFATTLILSAATDTWRDMRVRAPESFFGALHVPGPDERSDADDYDWGIGALLADLAGELPPQTVTATTALAQMELNLAVNAVVRAYARGGRAEADRVARETLEAAGLRVRDRAEATER